MFSAYSLVLLNVTDIFRNLGNNLRIYAKELPTSLILYLISSTAQHLSKAKWYNDCKSVLMATRR